MDMGEGNDFAAAFALLLVENVLQGDAAQIIVDGFVEVFPQIVGEAGRAVVAVGLAAALGGIKLVFCGGNDLGDADFAGAHR